MEGGLGGSEFGGERIRSAALGATALGRGWERIDRPSGGDAGEFFIPALLARFFAFRSTSHLAVPPPNNTSYLGHLALPMPPDFVPACPLEPARRSTLLQATPCLEVSPRQRRACLCCPLRNDRRPTTMYLSSLSPEASSLKEALERFVSERCVPAEPECRRPDGCAVSLPEFHDRQPRRASEFDSQTRLGPVPDDSELA